jgi:hypothetical protein
MRGRLDARDDLAAHRWAATGHEGAVMSDTNVPDEEYRDEQPGDPESPKTPGAPDNADPMSESTDGGLEGGAPGVEE